jgi:hypothetical protein
MMKAKQILFKNIGLVGMMHNLLATQALMHAKDAAAKAAVHNSAADEGAERAIEYLQQRSSTTFHLPITKLIIFFKQSRSNP